MHRTLSHGLKRSIIIGVTDWEATRAAPSEPLPGPKPEFFFVPTYAAERLKAEPHLGPAMLRDLRKFYPASRAFVEVQRITGAGAIQAAWSVSPPATCRRGKVWCCHFEGLHRCALLTHEKGR